MAQSRGSIQRPKSLFWLSVITTIGLFTVNIFGFLDTDTGSALGCGKEWPLCQGGLMPTDWTEQAIIEFSHRIVVFVVGILAITLCVMAWRRYRAWVEIKAMFGVAIGCVLLESFFGALGVLFSDPPAVLAVHLGIAILALTGVVLMTVVIRQIDKSWASGNVAKPLRPVPASSAVKRWVWLGVIYTYAAMYFGAYVENTGDGALFQGWPFPTEKYSVVHSALIVDYIHRTIALGLVLLIIRVLVMAYRIRHERRDLLNASILALILVCTQALSGAYLVFSHMSIQAFLVHVTNVSALFATMAYMVLQVMPEPQRAKLQERQQVMKYAQGQ